MAQTLALLATRTTVNGVPSGASAGIETSAIRDMCRQRTPPVTLLAASTAGSDTMTFTGRIWGYVGGAVAAWFPMGTGTGALKGVINGQAAVDETGADVLVHSEGLDLWFHFDRLYFQLAAIGGTATSVGAWLRVEDL